MNDYLLAVLFSVLNLVPLAGWEITGNGEETSEDVEQRQ